MSFYLAISRSLAISLSRTTRSGRPVRAGCIPCNHRPGQPPTCGDPCGFFVVDQGASRCDPSLRPAMLLCSFAFRSRAAPVPNRRAPDRAAAHPVKPGTSEAWSSTAPTPRFRVVAAVRQKWTRDLPNPTQGPRLNQRVAASIAEKHCSLRAEGFDRRMTSVLAPLLVWPSLTKSLPRREATTRRPGPRRPTTIKVRSMEAKYNDSGTMEL